MSGIKNMWKEKSDIQSRRKYLLTGIVTFICLVQITTTKSWIVLENRQEKTTEKTKVGSLQIKIGRILLKTHKNLETVIYCSAIHDLIKPRELIIKYCNEKCIW